jgi:hypothetical protein
VITGNSIAGRTVIQKGVAAGDTLITDGQMRVVPGMKVAIRKQ